LGPEAKIRAAAEAAGVDISDFRLEPVPHNHAAARAVALVRAGEAQLLMNASLHTDELMHEVMAIDTGQQTGRRISHVYITDVPRYPRPPLITDAAVNIAPNIEDKRTLSRTPWTLAHIRGNAQPRVAIDRCARSTHRSDCLRGRQSTGLQEASISVSPWRQG
jgi:phosphotransacetylase